MSSIKITIKEECSLLEFCRQYINLVVQILRLITITCDLSSLKEIVVSSSEHEIYKETVLFYSQSLGSMFIPTNTGHFQGGAVVLSGKDENDDYKQILIIKDMLCGTLEIDLLEDEHPFKQMPEYIPVKNTGLSIFMHEIGHVIDNATIHGLGYVAKEVYNIYDEADYIEFLKDECIVLWSEYYAETFSCRMCDDNREFKFDDLLYALQAKDMSDALRKREKIDIVYRIFYLLVHNMAYYHTHKGEKLNYSLLNEFSEYIPFFERFENSFLKIYSMYPSLNINENFNESYQIFDEFLNCYWNM